MAKRTVDPAKTIRNDVGDLIEVHINDLVEFQGELKTLSKINYEKLKRQILDLGFSSPFHVWRDGKELKLLDGHQRLRTLKNMVQVDGYKCGKLPAVVIDASSYEQAKRKLLALTSQYGEVTSEGLYGFVSDVDIDFDTLSNDFRFPEIGIGTYLTAPLGEPQEDMTENTNPDDGEESPDRKEGAEFTCDECGTVYSYHQIKEGLKNK